MGRGAQEELQPRRLLVIYIFPPLPSAFKPKASCIRSLRNPNPRNISVLVTLSENSKAEFGAPLMLAWQGHLGVQQLPLPSQPVTHSLWGPALQNNPRPSVRGGDDTAFLCTNDILTYIM